MGSDNSLTRRAFNSAALASLLPFSARAPSPDNCARLQTNLADRASVLPRAYPDFIASANEREVVWHDGHRMPVQLYPLNRPYHEQLNQPDLASQLLQIYPTGDCATPVTPNDDPGRIRYEPFFARMYGATEAEVRKNLRSVGWLTDIGVVGAIQVTRFNSVAFNLIRIAEELAALPSEQRRYMLKPGGGFYWRKIAGTNRLSGHSFGIAIDINVALSDYWRNEIPGEHDEPTYWRPRRTPRAIPREIIQIFEHYGFIWGGRWYHYDTMHFEYRPELLSP